MSAKIRFHRNGKAFYYILTVNVNAIGNGIPAQVGVPITRLPVE